MQAFTSQSLNTNASVHQLQVRQAETRSHMYNVRSAAFRRCGYTPAAYQDAEYLTAKEAYGATVTELVALLGGRASCASVDVDLWELYAEVFEGIARVRPSNDTGRAQVQEYLNEHRAEYLS